MTPKKGIKGQQVPTIHYTENKRLNNTNKRGSEFVKRDRQYNDKKKTDKRTNNDLQSTTQKTKH